MGRSLIMGSEGPMGKIIYACTVNLPEQTGRLVSIRTTAINAAMAIDAWLKEHEGQVHLWTISAWDTTAMGRMRHEQVGSVSAAGADKPQISHVHTMESIVDQYLANIEARNR